MANAWDKLPKETSKAYIAFQTYLSLPPFSEDPSMKRTQGNVMRRLGHNTPASVNLWSRTHNWVERAEAYDEHCANQSMMIRETGLAEFQNQIVQNLTTQLTVVDSIINRRLTQMLDDINTGKPVNAMEIKRLTSALKDKDDLQRRTAGMPTTYRSEEGVEAEEATYIIGVSDGD